MSEPTQQQSSHIFRIKNWFRWVIDAHNIGYSDADIRFVLDTIGVHEEMKRILYETGLETDNQNRTAGN